MTRRKTGPRDDAFGRMLLDHYMHGDSLGAIERDDGYVDVHDAAAYFSTAQSWPKHVQAALRMARGRVLDVGCGAGRFALHLQSKGCAVWSIDPSPRLVRLCRTLGVKHVKQAVLDRAPDLGHQFDTVIMMGNNLSLLGSWSAGRRRLRMLARVTSPDARLIGETFDPYGGNRHHRAYHRRNRAPGAHGRAGAHTHQVRGLQGLLVRLSVHVTGGVGKAFAEYRMAG